VLIFLSSYYKIKWILNDLNEIMDLLMSSALMSRLFFLTKGLGACIRGGAFIRNFTVILLDIFKNNLILLNMFKNSIILLKMFKNNLILLKMFKNNHISLRSSKII
jgi:hypothetical protein